MRNILLAISCFVLLSGCKVFRSNLMLKTPKNFAYDNLVDSLSRLDYRLAPNDAIQYKVFPNYGFKLIDLATTSTAILRNDLDAVIQSDGFVKMPMLGRVHIAGRTLREAELLLEHRYDSLYKFSFVTLRVINKRVIVFPGNGGVAQVIPLANNNTSVMEALASAGGIMQDGKAYKIKLIRDNPDRTKMPFVYLMDLSTIDGIMQGKSIVQAGDIIYVEPRYRPLATFNREIAPVITLLTSLFILYQFSRLN
jgi:polysaccharide biosynthesis/export protein